MTNGNGHTNGHQAPDLDLEPSVARDIEVTRRLYRSGESEYLIDGQSCRLRDIHDLLMDTGLGAKAYAIIEQGKIGMILSSRPTDRRMLIEEAAGVTKYKARRRAAELKLEAAQQNLTRIDDIVFEVEKQRGTLKRQAAKARRYRKLRDEAASLGKGPLGPEVSASWRRRSTRRGPARRRARARGGRCGARGRGRSHPRARADRARGGRIGRARRPRGGARTRAVDHDPPAADRPSIASRCQSLGERIAQIVVRDRDRPARREPAQVELARRREQAAEADAERDRAATALASESEAYEAANRQIEGLEADVEGGAQRGVFGDQLCDGSSPRPRTRGVGPRPRGRDALEAAGRG